MTGGKPLYSGSGKRIFSTTSEGAGSQEFEEKALIAAGMGYSRFRCDPEFRALQED
jgi:hypothetical protein